jgi:MFS family permease
MARFKLSTMMLLQYMMYAVWWVPLAAYLTNLEVGSIQKSLILSSMAIGCIASPVIGMLADRFFAAQKVLFGLNLINAVMLFLAGTTNNPDLLFIFLIVAMLGYMPSWGINQFNCNGSFTIGAISKSAGFWLNWLGCFRFVQRYFYQLP